MTQPKTIFVKVPSPKKGDGKTTPDEESRVCPIHASDNPHGGDLMLRPEDDAVEVFNSANIRRRIRSNDLVIAKAPAAKPAKE